MSNRVEELTALIEKHGIQINKKRKRSLLEMEDLNFEAYKAGIEAGRCCRDMDLEGAYKVFDHASKLNLPVANITYTNLLALTAGLGEQGHGSVARKERPPQDYHKAMEIYSHMKQLGIHPSEAAFSAMIRCCCQTHHLYEALSIYGDLKALTAIDNTTIVPKLRCYTSLLSAFSHLGDVTTCQRLFIECKDVYHLVPSEREYVSMIRACSQHLSSSLSSSHLQHVPSGGVDGQSIQELKDRVLLPFTVIPATFLSATLAASTLPPSPTAAVASSMHTICMHYLQECMEELLVLSEEDTLLVLKEYFTIYSQLIATADTIADMAATVESAYIIQDSPIDVATGKIECNKVVLQSIDLEPALREHFLQEFARLAVLPREGATSAAIAGNAATADAIDGLLPQHKLNNKIKSLHQLLAATPATTAVAPATATAAIVSTSVDAVATEEASQHPPQPRQHRHPSSSYNKPEDRLQRWQAYESFLQQAAAAPKPDNSNSKRGYSIILDGANIGYYKQNFINAPLHIDYHQVMATIRALIKQGGKDGQQQQHRPLLILHSRHLTPIGYDRAKEEEEIAKKKREKQEKRHETPEEGIEEVDEEEVEEETVWSIIDEWKRLSRYYSHHSKAKEESTEAASKESDEQAPLPPYYVYFTPKGFNDDWFWLYASLYSSCPVITNDDMKDHHFFLLSPKHFLRWRERYRVTYDLYYRRRYVNLEELQGHHRTRVSLTFPRCYSHRMQYIKQDVGRRMIEGYYIPPLVEKIDYLIRPPASAAAAEQVKAANTDGKEADESLEKAEGTTEETFCEEKKVKKMEGIVENVIEDKKANWLCIYRTVDV